MKYKVLYWSIVPVLVWFTGTFVLTRGECGEFSPFSSSECAANDSDAMWTAHNIVHAYLDYAEPIDRMNWPRMLKVNNKFSAIHHKNERFQFLLNENASGSDKDVDVLFFLADEKVGQAFGGRNDLLPVFGEFSKKPKDNDSGRTEGWTIIIRSDLKVEEISVSKALKLRWSESDPKRPTLPKWDDTKFNGGRKYESERY